jgi:SAM-dependent methyltransferase
MGDTPRNPTEQDIKAWYNRRYADRGLGSMRPPDAYQAFLNVLDVQPGRILLDIACGTGFLLHAAAQRGLKTYGTDISEEAARLSKQTSPESEVLVGKGEDLEFADGMFDYITCIGSLEHFLDMDKGLGEMKRVAKSDALLCITVPNSNFLYWRVSGKHGTEQQDINEHLMSLSEWKGLFSRNGLEVVRIRQDRWPMKKIRPFATPNPLRIVRDLAFKLVWALLPLKSAYQFIFVLKKRPI